MLSTEQSFGIAATMAFRQGMLEAQPVLLEPIMEVAISLPESFLGDAIADLNGRRAKVMGIDSQESGLQVIKAHVPLAAMFGYSTALRSVTQGRATFTMQFASYDRVPEKKAEAIILRIRGI